MNEYQIIMKLIERGRTDGLKTKVSKVYLLGNLTDAEYDQIMDILQQKEDVNN